MRKSLIKSATTLYKDTLSNCYSDKEIESSISVRDRESQKQSSMSESDFSKMVWKNKIQGGLIVKIFVKV